MFGPSRRVARRTARRTSRRQAYFRDMAEGGYDEPEPQYAPPPPAAPAEPDYAAELQKLATLRDQGIIDDAEFEAKKKQILGL
jgi:hypothetical protein